MPQSLITGELVEICGDDHLPNFQAQLATSLGKAFVLSISQVELESGTSKGCPRTKWILRTKGATATPHVNDISFLRVKWRDHLKSMVYKQNWEKLFGDIPS